MKLTTAVEVSERLGDDVKFWLLRFTLRCFTSTVNAYEAIFFLYSLCSNRFICSFYILSSSLLPIFYQTCQKTCETFAGRTLFKNRNPLRAPQFLDVYRIWLACRSLHTPGLSDSELNDVKMLPTVFFPFQNQFQIKYQSKKHSTQVMTSQRRAIKTATSHLHTQVLYFR